MGMIQTIIEVFSFNYIGSTLLCGPFSKWPHFEKITQTRNTLYYTAIEAFCDVTPLCRFRGITQIRIEVFSLITSPPEGVARYCFHPVCLSVYVSVCLCVCVRPIFLYFIYRLLEEILIWNFYRILIGLYSQHFEGTVISQKLSHRNIFIDTS